MKFAVFGRLNDWLMDLEANSEQEALAKAKIETPYAEKVISVKTGGDLGVDGN